MNSASTIIVSVNGQPHTLAANGAVHDLVRALSLEGKRIAVELNGRIVARSRYAETPLQHGDRLEIVGAVGGG